MGYITSSPAPIGMLADLLAAAVNPNVGGWELSPMASEIEAETVRWVAELVGYPADCGGLLVSGGNMANFLCFLAGRRAMLGESPRAAGLGGAGRLRVYASEGTHTWIQKAADLFGMGTDSIRWIGTDESLRMHVPSLREAIRRDRAAGDRPIMVVGAAGTVGTGAVDPIGALAAVCRDEGLWFHVDGAYGAPAALLPDAPADLKALRLADSVAVDPHKWLYAPLEAGCVLVREAHRLPRGLRLSPDVLPFRDRGRSAAHQLLRVRPSELARVPGAQGVARAPAGGPGRLRPDDRRRLPAGAPAPRRRRGARRAGGHDHRPEHCHLPVRSDGHRACRRRGGRRISTS